MGLYKASGPDELHEWEALRLAPYATTSRSSRGRLYPTPQPDPRLEFQRDRDRILHSTAFRRLQYKTQVFVFHEGDFYRTRLTHSLEVAQIGQTMARMLRANEDLVEAISLAHDLGHPPFGHGGEEELKSLMAGRGGFEHNRQALRIVDELEVRYPQHPGLNLTWETREGIARHTTFFDHPDPPAEFAQTPQPGLEAQISSVADMIAYCTHDLEDALIIGFVRDEELQETVRLWREVTQQTAVETAGMGGYLQEPGPVGAGTEEGTPEGRAKGLSGTGTRSSRPLLTAQVSVRYRIRCLIDRLIRDVVAHTLRRLEAWQIDSPDKVRQCPEPVVGFSMPVYEGLEELRDVLYHRVYRDPRTLRMVYKGRMILRELFHALAAHPDMLPRITRERWSGGGGASGEEPDYGVLRDYIAGMTDRYAMDLYNTLCQPYETSLRGLS